MPVFLLDTDILSLFQHHHAQVVLAVAAHAQDRICICSVTVEEQLGGWSPIARSAKTHPQHEFAAQLLCRLVHSWCRFGLVAYTTPAMQRFDQLLKAKLNVGRYDLRIASIALELGATVVTRNRRDFGRVAGLPIEDWSV